MMSLKKGMLAAGLGAMLAMSGLVGSAGAEAVHDVKVIPYPAGLDTNTEGASSAPAEINHQQSAYFKHLDVYEMKDTDTLTVLHHYPTYQQSREYTCGPAAALTVLYWYGDHDYDEMSLAEGMKTQGYPIGTNPENMVKFFQKLGWKVESSMKADKISRYDESLKQGSPIMVENVEWGGHWRVIIGYDTLGTESPLDDMLILADPYDTCDHQQDGYVVQNAEKFFSMWFDHYMLPEDQRYQPWIIAHP